MLSQRIARACVLVLSLVAAAAPASATWSIVVRNRRTGEMCVATSTCLSGVDIARFVPVIRAEYGVGAAQSFVLFNAANRRRIFQNMDREAATPQALLDHCESLDAGFQQRQFGLVTRWGPPATFTGTQNGAAALGVAGVDGDLEYAIQGNVLTGPNVIGDCEVAFLTAPGDLGQRVVAAMEAARDAGGDGRCSCNSSAPTSCGSPPPSFTYASTNAFMALVRPGDVDGNCTGAQGCATGDYFMRINYVGTLQTTEPITELRTQYEAWRAALAGRPDAVRSVVEQTSPLLQADGLTLSEVTVRLVDIEGVPLTTGGQTVTVARREGPAVATAGSVVDNGDGTFTFDLLSTSVPGEAAFAITVDDGVRPVELTPAVHVESVAPRALHASRAAITGADPEPLLLTLQADPQDAGDAYRVLGSLSGTSPGTQVGAVLVPLNRDRFFDFTETWGGAPPFTGNSGVLTQVARAEATLALPQGAASALVGSTLSFAAIVGGDEVTNVVEVAVE